MKFYKYWTSAEESILDPSGQSRTRKAFGFSNEGLHHAQQIARERAKKLVANWRNQPARRESEYYPTEGAIREQIIEEFHEGDQQVAVVSRNSYGTLVLNTPDVFFADVDLPLPGCWTILTKWFKKTPDFETMLIQKVEKLIDANPELGLRVYRTRQGFRIVATSRTVPANDDQSRHLLDQLGADKLYVSLCRSQDCYRARLSPKPWRCGSTNPPSRFPFETEDSQNQFQDWLKQYDTAARNWATCELVGNFGIAEIDPRVDSILNLHDHFSLNPGKPLA